MPEQDEQTNIEKNEGRGLIHILLAIAGIIVSALWLLNLSAGFIEIPDNLPFVGNIDEALATAVMIACFRYLGMDILPFLPGRSKKSSPEKESDR